MTTTTFAMDDLIFAMPEALQDSLDTLVSTHSSAARRSQALTELDQLVAQIFTPSNNNEILEIFCSLQDTFECNVPSRMLAWIAGSTPRLEGLIARGPDREAEVVTLSSHLTQCLSIVQGIALAHESSKVFLGRKYPLEVLLDLLLVSRHLPSPNTDSTTAAGSSAPSTPSRTPSPPKNADANSPGFCKLNGVQIVVKILKRVNTPRDVRMKCLEFLYFYLMDETSPSALGSVTRADSNTPVTPLSPSPFIISEGKPKSRPHGSPLRDASSSSDDSFTSNSSHSSSLSISSTSSLSSSSTVPPSSPTFNLPKTPPKSPPRSAADTRLRSPLRKDMDAIPVTPKKVPLARLSKGHSRTSSLPAPMSKSKRSSDLDAEDYERAIPRTPDSKHESDDATTDAITPEDYRVVRTTEEKKQLLGNMLGNIDALVEGVRKAGIWGLG
ncbi:hypothetical protein EW146_g3792 [Bondarzewia mesenterica]|uniref:Cell division control protein 14 n=1 Tax=Bondarzewia mesenterica TaxID=1095465 RepID=A0A4V3XFC6_9AGAM|nr:hypothetical protein EW146_g3792 [Bondarzewia mesenterica]